MARFTIDEIGNVPLAPDEVSQEAVELFMARNPPGKTLIIRSNAAREAYGYEVAPDQAADTVRSTSFRERLYEYGAPASESFEDRRLEHEGKVWQTPMDMVGDILRKRLWWALTKRFVAPPPPLERAPPVSWRPTLALATSALLLKEPAAGAAETDTGNRRAS
jgi:hypothetical protein